MGMNVVTNMSVAGYSIIIVACKHAAKKCLDHINLCAPTVNNVD